MLGTKIATIPLFTIDKENQNNYLLYMEIFYAILALITGVGVSLVGIVMFNKGLEKGASGSMRILLDKIGKNRFASFGVGVGVTAIVQSSSATTAMVVGLVNAGLVTLFQAAAISLGAHLGATFIGILVSLSTFRIKYFFMALAFIGALMSFMVKKRKIRNIANLLIGFGILFIGLELMGNAFSDNLILNELFTNLFTTVNFPALLILLGIMFVAIIQSSGAAIAIFLTMAGSGLMGIEIAMFLVLGANIGTANTALFAAIPADIDAKRAALANLIMNVVGVIGFTAIIWPLKPVLAEAYERIIPDPVWQVSIFNIIFNVTKSLPLLYLINPINRLACRLIKDKPEDEEELRTSYIDDSLLETPAFAMTPVKKEIIDMARMSRNNLIMAFEAFFKQDLYNKKRIKKQEEWINFLNKAVSNFVVKLSESELSKQENRLLGGFHHAVNDIERIGDYAKKMLQEAGSMKKRHYEFSKKSAAKGLTEMFDIVSRMFDLSLEIFESGNEERLKELYDLDTEADKMKLKLSESHIKWLKSSPYNTIGGGYFYSCICDLERIADHLVNFASVIHVIEDNRAKTETPLPPEVTESS